MRDNGSTGWALPGLLVVATAAFALLLGNAAPEAYYVISQEDHWIEWSTVWAFLLAMAVFAVAAREYARVHRLPWYYGGLAVFCLLVAMEEISWGQRLFSYRPPTYFLADNFQQELNLHNVIDSAYRKWALQAVILGYGVILPLAGRLPPSAKWLSRIGVVAPPVSLLPAFAVTSALYFVYPLDATGEWVELMLGLTMLLAAMAGVVTLRGRRPGTLALSVAPLAAALVLGAATLWLTTALHVASPEAIARTREEIRLLTEDFSHERVATRCGVHKRVYTFQREYGQRYLRQGAFAHLAWPEADARRAEFFLDPWNMPYWVRHTCSKDRSRQAVLIYSFGPDRRRESTNWSFRGDDIGAMATPHRAPASDR